MSVISQNKSNSKSFCVSFESKRSKNANETDETDETIKANFVEFSKISHVDFDAKIEKNELLFCLRENAIVKTISNFCKKINFDWSLNHSKTNSSRHADNHSNMSDFEYWFWHCCWKCCRKFTTSLNNLEFKFSKVSFE